MTSRLMGIIALTLLWTCKEASNKPVESIDYSKAKLEITTSIYPETITKVFDAHGGLDQWNQMQTLTFTMLKPTGKEVTTTDLKQRYSHIDMPHHAIGYDGSKVWLQQKDTTAYEGNPKFYCNLMFYFYAMPFVLADDGIHYEDVPPLEFEGQRFPGVKISYESGIGESSDDEYILYYDAETYQMTWLAYTVTFFSKEKGKEFHFIKYSDWQTVNGLMLPKTLTWYEYDNNVPTTTRNTLTFSEVLLTPVKTDVRLFQKPNNAQEVE